MTLGVETSISGYPTKIPSTRTEGATNTIYGSTSTTNRQYLVREDLVEEDALLLVTGTPLAGSQRPAKRLAQQFEIHFSDLIPSDQEVLFHHQRSWRRRMFLLITEPETSLLSAIFYAALVVAIFASNSIMIMQTMDAWQFTPDDCRTCGGNITYLFEDDDIYIVTEPGVACVCPPEPLEFTITALDLLMRFFTMEWCLRVVLYEHSEPSPSFLGRCGQSLEYLTSPSTLVDALATFPYYLESLPNGFVSLRLIRMFRIFQLIRLGQYNEMFMTLSNVLAKSLNYLKLMVLILAFGAALFGSILFWVEKGTWKYHEESGTYRFLRTSLDGVTEEPSPFGSIPQAFWWFMVTATTVGYGDTYPTTTAGKWVAVFAMLMGVLVIAFPVSVFSDLWSQELESIKGFENLKSNDTNDNAEVQPASTTTSKEKKSETEPQTDKKDAAAVWSYAPPSGGAGTTPNRFQGVVVSPQDWQTLMERIERIQQDQKQIQTILQKYARGQTYKGT
eukprot:Nitzschia sp. Nitz4//scaffold302_size22357//17178//18852//NITZ4_008561-RA/size22357-processed-gene-0.13-mRNA-1//-1//CDS//3329547038//2487//frame0